MVAPWSILSAGRTGEMPVSRPFISDRSRADRLMFVMRESAYHSPVVNTGIPAMTPLNSCPSSLT